jgi:Flp pilus assembly protein TadD
LLGLATVSLAREDFAAALAAYDRLVARAPEHAAAHLGRAYCLLSLGRKEEGARAIDRGEALGAPRANVTKLRELLAK